MSGQRLSWDEPAPGDTVDDFVAQVDEEGPCCIGYVTSGGDDRCHEPDCADRPPPPAKHFYKTSVAWAGSGTDGDPWVMVSWEVQACTCARPWRHSWPA